MTTAIVSFRCYRNNINKNNERCHRNEFKPESNFDFELK